MRYEAKELIKDVILSLALGFMIGGAILACILMTGGPK